MCKCSLLVLNQIFCRPGEEIGMLEDMEVGISDLHSVTFKITEAASEEANSLQPTVSGRRWERPHKHKQYTTYQEIVIPKFPILHARIHGHSKMRLVLFQRPLHCRGAASTSCLPNITRGAPRGQVAARASCALQRGHKWAADHRREVRDLTDTNETLSLNAYWVTSLWIWC